MAEQGTLCDNRLMKRHSNPLLTMIFDVVIFSFVLISAIWLFGYMEPSPENKWEYLHYFTVLSNLLGGVTAGIYIVYDFLILKGKMDHAPRRMFLLWLSSSGALGVTMRTVLFFLGPTQGYAIMYAQANMFMHLLTPLVVMLRTFLFGSRQDELRFKEHFLALFPMILYGAYYLINNYVHDGFNTPRYDWYGFGIVGKQWAWTIYLLMIAITEGINLGLYSLRKALINRNKLLV